MTIIKKLSLTTVTISILLGLTLSFLLYAHVSDLMKEQIIHSQIESAKTIMRNINQKLLQAKKDILMLSEDEFLQEYVSSPGKEHSSYSLLKEELEERMEITGPWDYLMIVDHNGKTIFSVGETHKNITILDSPNDLQAFKSSMDGISYNSDFVISKYTHHPILIYAIAITNEEGQPIGALIAHYRWTSIEKILYELPSNITAHLFNEKGMVIAAAEEYKGQDNHDHFSDIPLIKQLLNTKNTVSSISPAIHGEHESLSVIVHQNNHKDLHTFDWILILEQPTHTLFSPIGRLAVQSGFLLFIALLLFTFLLSFFAHRILAPLQKLTEVSSKIGNGEFTQHVPINSNDEIGILSTSFNSMTDRLQQRTQELINSENRFSRVVNSVSDIIYQTDIPSFRPLYINDAVEPLLGFTPKEIISSPDIRDRQILEEDRERVMHAINAAYEANVDFIIPYRIRHKDGKTIKWFEERGKWETDSKGEITSLYSVMNDITERKEAEKKIQQSSRALAAIHAVDTLINRSINEDDLIQGVCENIVDKAGYALTWIGLMDTNSHDIQIVAYSGHRNTLMNKLMHSSIKLKNIDPEIYSRLQKQGYYFIVDKQKQNGSDNIFIDIHKYGYSSLILFALKSESNLLGVIAIYDDKSNIFDENEIRLLKDLSNNLAYAISALRTQILRREAEKQITYQAYHDSLTGLPNRFMFMENLYQTINYCERYNEKFAILFIDLDDFKLVNDTLGHEAGDQLLRIVSQCLNKTARDSDIVARQGGDEFIILMRWSKSDKNSSHKPSTKKLESIDAALLSERIINTLKKPFEINGESTYVSASIGISIYPDDAVDADTLLSYADSAMYSIKNLGKGGFQFYSKELTIRQQKRMSIFSKLHDAIENEEFVLYYQPIVDLKKGCIIGVEALIRWQSNTGELIPPNDFLPVAEDTGLIIPIGDWVVQEVCRQIKQWQAEGINIYVALNLSVRQLLKEEHYAKILKIINKTGIPKKSIELEITESALSLDTKRMESIINAFHQEGISISLDDFGTGYSSLSRLKHLPIKTLKIDKSFVDGIPHSEDDTAIVIATLQLAKSLNIHSLSEGIETIEQYEWLHRHGCQYAQGYYFSRPVPASEIKQLINTDFSKELKEE